MSGKLHFQRPMFTSSQAAEYILYTVQSRGGHPTRRRIHCTTIRGGHPKRRRIHCTTIRGGQPKRRSIHCTIIRGGQPKRRSILYTVQSRDGHPTRRSIHCATIRGGHPKRQSIFHPFLLSTKVGRCHIFSSLCFCRLFEVSLGTKCMVKCNKFDFDPKS